MRIPTKAEFEEHMISHYPFRSWCPHCVKGKSNAAPHRMDKGVVNDHPTIHLDYCFPVKRELDQTVDDYVKLRGAPILIMFDDKLDLISACYVKEKGVNPRSVAALKSFIEKLGHKKITFKSDQENAILALRAKRHTWVEIVDEKSKAYDSQSNGKIEVNVQIFETQLRTLRDSLESRLCHRINGDHPCVSWMVEHSAKTINRFRVGPDVVTAYRRWKGKNFNVEMPEFGEYVFYLPRKRDITDKSSAKWKFGIFVGVSDESNEMMIADTEKVKCVRDVRRHVRVKDRWDKAKFDDNIKYATWEHKNNEEDYVDEDMHVNLPSINDPITPVPEFVPEHSIKRMHLKADDAKRRGLWPLSCPGCRSIRDNARRQDHTDKCRESIEKMLKENDDPRFEESYERMAKHYMEKEKGEKRGIEEEQEEDHERKKRVKVDESTEESKMDTEGDQIMHIDVKKYFKVANLDAVNNFNNTEVRRARERIKNKHFGLTMYNEEVVAAVIRKSSAKQSAKGLEKQRG